VCVLFFLIPLVYMLLSLGLFYFLSGSNYDSIIGGYERTFPGAFDSRVIASHCFTPAWYAWLREHRVGGMAVLIALPLLYLAFGRRVGLFVRRLTEEIRKGLALLGSGLRGGSPVKRTGFLLLMAGVLAYRLYFYFSYPLHPDELCSYLYFVRPGPFISITSYPLPNNHVLFNLFCSLINLLPGLVPRAVMRLPSLAGDIFLLYSVFCLVRRWDGYERAMVSVAGIAFVRLISYYAVQGRGYQWLEVCAVISALACWECFREAVQDRRGYALFVVSSAAGFYINPAFLYHFMALGLWCCYVLIRRRAYGDLVFFGRCVGMVVGLAALLYLPLILSSSWRALVSNGYVTGVKSYGELYAQFPDLVYLFKEMLYYGTVGMYCLLVLGGILVLAYWKGLLAGSFYDYLLAYLFSLAAALGVLILYQKIYPLERALCYLAMALNLFFVNACYDLLRRYFGRAGNWLMVVLLLGKTALSVRGLYWERFGVDSWRDVKVARTVEADIRRMVNLHPRSWQITDSDDYYSMYIQEYLIRKGDGGKVWFSRTETIGDVIFLPDSYLLSFPPGKYVLWADGKRTAHGRVLRIYVLSSLAGEKR